MTRTSIATAKNFVWVVAKTADDLGEQRLAGRKGVGSRMKVKARIHTAAKQANAAAVYKIDVVGHCTHRHPCGAGDAVRL